MQLPTRLLERKNSMTDDKYKMFRNYMANELGIEREDIERWTREAATIAASKAVKRLLNDEPTLRREMIKAGADRVMKEYDAMGQIRNRVAEMVFDAAMKRWKE